MLNEKKVRAMNRLALYERGRGKKHLLISRYYRTDYVGQALIRTFFLVTIGYFLILALLAAYFSEYLMNNIHKMDLRVLALSLGVGHEIVDYEEIVRKAHLLYHVQLVFQLLFRVGSVGAVAL